MRERVVELVGAGVQEVLPLEVQRAAGLRAQARGAVEGRRPPGVVAQQRRELLAEPVVGAGGLPTLLELGQRGHQRLRHVLAPVGPEAVLDGAHGDSRSAGSRPDTASKNASRRWGSLRPGSASTPLATSTA